MLTVQIQLKDDEKPERQPESVTSDGTSGRYQHLGWQGGLGCLQGAAITYILN